jgi:hypothetical protein
MQQYHLNIANTKTPIVAARKAQQSSRISTHLMMAEYAETWKKKKKGY